MDEILQHLRNPGTIRFPLAKPTVVSLRCERISSTADIASRRAFVEALLEEVRGPKLPTPTRGRSWNVLRRQGPLQSHKQTNMKINRVKHLVSEVLIRRSRKEDLPSLLFGSQTFRAIQHPSLA